ncbi:YigZ family protein [Pseudodesulfovibrio sp.]|nr:YigZ family protein [Pseudodesulfovibrio sp.]
MPDRYPIPAATHRVEESIKRSRFIASAAHAPDAESAKAFIAAMKAEFPDATHNCWAYVAGPPGDTAQVGMSDDGEPHGTAGKPMLNTLLHADIGEIVVVATRYFGGTKLGTGGLVRAYTSMVNAVLEALPTKEKVELSAVTVTIPYPSVTLFKRMLSDFEAEALEETFTDEAAFVVVMPVERMEGFTAQLAELTDGRGKIVEN